MTLRNSSLPSEVAVALVFYDLYFLLPPQRHCHLIMLILSVASPTPSLHLNTHLFSYLKEYPFLLPYPLAGTLPAHSQHPVPANLQTAHLFI